MKVCVITDNSFIYEQFKIITNEKKDEYSFFYSENNKTFDSKYCYDTNFNPISLKKCDIEFFNQFDVYLSLHCKQLFPEVLVNNYRCINVHPGLNPYNRGWFPQVFSIINKLPVGVTVHEMDAQLDHGPIIYQEEIEVYDEDTSKDVYLRIQQLEIDLIRTHIDDLVTGSYTALRMNNEGNINFKSDFNKLCQIDMKQEGTFEEFYDLLRALTFAPYDNAFFINKNGEKVFVSIIIKKGNKCD